MMHAANMGPESPGDGRKGKRELSTSKRAAQNRAAQVREQPQCILRCVILRILVKKMHIFIANREALSEDDGGAHLLGLSNYSSY